MVIDSVRAFLLNPWAWVQFFHNQMAALVTASFVIAAVGAFYTLRRLHPVQSGLYLRSGTLSGLIASMLVAFPSGDQQAKAVARYQPVTLAAMEGKFTGGSTAGAAVIGQPNTVTKRLLAIAYFIFISRRYAGKVSVRRDNQGFY